MVLNSWHRGEQAVHSKLHTEQVNAGTYTWIDDQLPTQHRVFYNKNIIFLPVATLDRSGRPWGSFVYSRTGTKGFITSPTQYELKMTIDPQQDDPLVANLEAHLSGDRSMSPLIAGVGIDFTNRRRNKFAGIIKKASRSQDGGYELNVGVNETIGNCPKYITIRNLVPSPSNKPETLHKVLHLEPDEKLPQNIIEMITASDTVFLGTSFAASGDEASLNPSHLGINHRGGRPGFVRVMPNGRSIVIPDYSGNRLMTSLGNIAATPVASISILDFSTGTVLYLTGTASNAFGEEAQAIQPRSDLVTLLDVSGYICIKNAAPFRQEDGVAEKPSPYSPPVRSLRKERPEGAEYDNLPLVLTRIRLYSSSIATFTFRSEIDLTIEPGQNIVADCTSFIGSQGYQHMAHEGMEASLNDDGVRTWTVSHFDPSHPRQFGLTLRHKPLGAVTSKLFDVAKSIRQIRPDLLDNTLPLKLTLNLVGVGGEFTLPKSASKILMLAGGIGITPFLAILSDLVRTAGRPIDIVLGVSTREAEALLKLFFETIGDKIPEDINLQVHLFVGTLRNKAKETIQLDKPFVTLHGGRVGPEFLNSIGDLFERDVMICGPEEWEAFVTEILRQRGVPAEKIRREGFTY